MKYSILTFILAFLLSGCSIMEDYEDHCPVQGEDEAGFVTLSFKLISSSIATSRADADDNPKETNNEWPAFEDMIQANDFAFFIFCEQEDGTWPLVLKMTDIKNSTDPNMMITGAPGTYTVTAVISKDKLGHDITSGSKDLVNFRMVVLANTGAANNYDALDTTSYDEFIKAASELKINIKDTIYKASSDSDSVDDLFKGGIPMFGLKEFNFSKGDLYSSRPEERLWVGNIYMLRALSKIRVVDKIQNKTEGFPRIESVTFQAWRPNAYIVPCLTGYKNGEQVENPRLAEAEYKESTTIKLGKLDPKDDTDTTWFGFIPEQAVSEDVPKFQIKVKYDDNEESTQIFTVPMTEYKGQTFNFGNYILRNHIYTLEVVLSEISFHIFVEPWNLGGRTEIEMNVSGMK